MFNLEQFEIGRRDVLKAGGLAAASLLIPARLLAQSWPSAGFTHGVASGEPRATSVLLWTRFVGTAEATALTVEVAEDAGFAKVVANAGASADVANDSCAKVTVTGLVPGRRYFYRFTAPDGSQSVTGRTRTLPVGTPPRFNVAVFSCSNMGFGYFNAYAHAARRSDIDLVVHVGDYIYEYQIGHYPDPCDLVPGRAFLPNNEIISESDYNKRYASYRTDPDLLELHQNFPWIAIWDDHEFANDAWKDGAENHNPDRPSVPGFPEGDWQVRKAAAKKAHNDWLPVSGTPYDRYDIGDLVSLITLDTRVEGRDEQLSLFKVIEGAAEPQKALAAFRDTQWKNSNRTLLGPDQERWLDTQLASSVQSGIKWQLLAQQLVMGPLTLPIDALGWLGNNPKRSTKAFVEVGTLAAKVKLPSNMDAWDGYYSARKRLLESAHSAGANLVVVSGDSHNAWAFDLRLNAGSQPVGVEFAGPGVTSPGFESRLKGVNPTVAAKILAARNSALNWCDLSQRGYMHVSFEPDAVRNEWVFMATVYERSLVTTQGHVATVKRGANMISKT